MITIMLGMCVWVGLGVVLWRDMAPFDAVDVIFYIFLGLISGVVAFGASVAVALGIGMALPTAINTTPTTSSTIVTLRSSDGVAGRFYLGSGVIDTTLYYFWYEQAADGAIIPRQHDAGEGTYVYQQNRPDAKVEVYRWHFTQPWASWVALEGGGETWRFYVPSGTVKTGFAL